MLFLIQNSAVILATASTQPEVGEPVCGSRVTYPVGYQAPILVNVTDSNAIVNVTLYYRIWPFNNGSITGWNELSRYNKSYMYENRNWNDTYEYYYDVKGNLNSSQVYGLVKVVDQAGNIFYSGGGSTPNYPVPTCTFYSPPPKATLDIEVTLTDVNPKFLNINASIRATLWNSETFSPISINDIYSGFYLYLKPSASDLVQYSGTGTANLGHVGYTQFFPVDSYTYYMYLDLSGVLNLNYSEVTMNGVNLTSGVPRQNVVNFTSNPTTQESTDNDQWTISSNVQYLPGVSAKTEPQIEVALTLTRQAGEVSSSILIPIISVYALLGASILIRGKNDLGNRLVVYLSVFVFTYELVTYIDQSIIIPAAVGPNMADLMVFALIPATAVLTFFSIVSWMPQFARRRNLLDGIAILFAAFVQAEEVRFNTLQYVLSNGRYQLATVTYGVGDLGIWGYATFAALFCGVLVLVALSVWKWLMKRSWFYSSVTRARFRLKQPIL